MLKCEICGKEIEQSQYVGDVLCSSKCFHKHFWKEIIAEKQDHIIIDGQCYCDGGNIDDPNRYIFCGFSGRRFWIRFFDGRTLTTNNLWYQGEIPDGFKPELPNTAVFYTPEHIKVANLLGGETN